MTINNTFSIVNTSFIVVCITMAIVFLTLPLPPNKGLSNYRKSLRFLSGAYLTMAILNIVILAFDISLDNFISVEVLTMASFQAVLFAIALIILLKPRFNAGSLMYKLLIPILLLDILYFMASIRWGDPEILDFDGLIQFAFHPAMIVRELFLLYYFFLLVYLTRFFLSQVRLFEKEIDNYFGDSLLLHLPGVKYSYYAALSIGIGALLSCFIISKQWEIIFTIAFTIFYLGFCIYYIQYPYTFISLEPAIYVPENVKNELPNTTRRINWDQLKKQIIEDKYYLGDGVNIQEMAQYLKFGRTTLSSFINNDEGMNFNQWINKLRVEEAKSLLVAYPNYNLAQIAELVGYSEASNFSRQFKIITTESPSVWRQNNKAKSESSAVLM
jgi:AraC-like DNA-binding protein